jgi:hypothetical protein
MMMMMMMVVVFNLDIQTVPTTKSGALQNVEFLLDLWLGFSLFFFTLMT